MFAGRWGIGFYFRGNYFMAAAAAAASPAITIVTTGVNQLPLVSGRSISCRKSSQTHEIAKAANPTETVN